MSCGPVSLTLAGIPSRHPDNLLLALIHQYQIQTYTFDVGPSTLISQLKHSLKRHRQSTIPSYPTTITGDLQSICDCFNIRLLLYFNNDRYDFISPSVSTFTAHLYFYQSYFDSVMRITPKLLINDPVPKYSHSIIKMSSWNVRGATDDLKRVMIDAELNSDKIMLAAIQESHLWSTNLSTKNFNWVLGSQSSQSRASRGLGFLIHRNFSPFVSHVSFPTTNIGVLTFQAPFMNFPFFLINVHKLNNGDIRNGIETGNNIFISNKLLN